MLLIVQICFVNSRGRVHVDERRPKFVCFVGEGRCLVGHLFHVHMLDRLVDVLLQLDH